MQTETQFTAEEQALLDKAEQVRQAARERAEEEKKKQRDQELYAAWVKQTREESARRRRMVEALRAADTDGVLTYTEVKVTVKRPYDNKDMDPIELDIIRIGCPKGVEVSVIEKFDRISTYRYTKTGSMRYNVLPTYDPGTKASVMTRPEKVLKKVEEHVSIMKARDKEARKQNNLETDAIDEAKARFPSATVEMHSQWRSGHGRRYNQGYSIKYVRVCMPRIATVDFHFEYRNDNTVVLTPVSIELSRDEKDALIDRMEKAR